MQKNPRSVIFCTFAGMASFMLNWRHLRRYNFVKSDQNATKFYPNNTQGSLSKYSTKICHKNKGEGFASGLL